MDHRPLSVLFKLPIALSHSLILACNTMSLLSKWLTTAKRPVSLSFLFFSFFCSSDSFNARIVVPTLFALSRHFDMVACNNFLVNRGRIPLARACPGAVGWFFVHTIGIRYTQPPRIHSIKRRLKFSSNKWSSTVCGLLIADNSVGKCDTHRRGRFNGLFKILLREKCLTLRSNDYSQTVDHACSAVRNRKTYYDFEKWHRASLWIIPERYFAQWRENTTIRVVVRTQADEKQTGTILRNDNQWIIQDPPKEWSSESSNPVADKSQKWNVFCSIFPPTKCFYLSRDASAISNREILTISPINQR